MSVEKYKPQSTPRILELPALSVYEQSRILIQDTKVVIEQTRRLISQSKELLGMGAKAPNRTRKR